MSTLHWEVRRRIAPIPIWRWTAWAVYLGRQCADITPHCRALISWAREKWSDQDELITELELDTLFAWEERGHSGVDKAEMIYRTPELRRVIEIALAAQVDADEIAAGMTAKLGAEVIPAHVRCYKEVFFDTENVPISVIAQWQGTRGLTWSTEYDSPLPGSLKKEWARSKLGLSARVDGAEALNFMLLRSIATSAMLTEKVDSMLAIEWQDQAIKLMRAGKEIGLFKNGKGKLPDHLVADPITDWEDLDGAPPPDEEVDFDDSYKRDP